MKKQNSVLGSKNYYNIHDSITKMNNKTFVTMQIGGRSIGKTHAWAIYCATRKNGITLWIRRKTDELRLASASFTGFLDRENEKRKQEGRKPLPVGKVVKEVIDMGDGTGRTILVDCYRNEKNQPKIYFLPLSIEVKFKSAQIANFDLVLFDEMCPTNNDYYLKNEPNCFFDLISSELRLNQAKIVFLSNLVDPLNPYFTFYRIQDFSFGHRPMYNGAGEKIGYIDFLDSSPEFKEAYSQSAIGRMTKGTPYDDYAQNRAFLKSVNVELCDVPAGARREFTLYNGEAFITLYSQADRVYLKEDLKQGRGFKVFVNDLRYVDYARDWTYPNDDVKNAIIRLLKVGKIRTDRYSSYAHLMNYLGR